MKAVLQRVKKASVSVDGNIVGTCNEGLLILLGVAKGDTETDVSNLAEKILKLRIFKDDCEKMNLSVCDINGEMLVVSQFTLLANYSHGNRPDYFDSASPETANKLYELFIDYMSKRVKHVDAGVFGANMSVELVNDGPVTIVMDSQVLRRKGNNAVC